MAQVIQELFRQVIKYERDKEEIRAKNNEEREYLLKKVAMADDDIKFKEKQLQLLKGTDAQEIINEIKAK